MCRCLFISRFIESIGLLVDEIMGISLLGTHFQATLNIVVEQWCDSVCGKKVGPFVTPAT